MSGPNCLDLVFLTLLSSIFCSSYYVVELLLRLLLNEVHFYGKVTMCFKWVFIIIMKDIDNMLK